MVEVDGLGVRLTRLALAFLSNINVEDGLFPPQTTLRNNTSYDYIVVGGGTAGCIVASRLVEDRTSSVLLLEAGNNPPLSALLPGLLNLLQSSSVSYNYTSRNNPYAASAQNLRTKLQAGKMLGGTASLNYLAHNRGLPEAFDYWAQVSGDDSWRYVNLVKYFKRNENIQDEEIFAAYPDYHGTNGPTGLKRLPRSELNVYFESFAEMGNPQVLEFNSQVRIGFAHPLYAIDDNVRQTPAITYVRPVKNYNNLHYSKLTRVTKILFNGNVAVAVEVDRGGTKYVLKAKKEIIISAGVFGTPQILMLSGIGPQNHLRAMNIDVKRNLPVGDNLIDTVQTVLVYKTKKYLLPLPPPRIITSLDLTEFPFPMMIGAVALNKTQRIKPDYRNYCLLIPHDTNSLSSGLRDLFGIRRDIRNRWQREVTSRDAFLCFVALIEPKSRGRVCLASTDPFDYPRITTNYYTNMDDLQNMIKYVRDFIRVGNSTFFRREQAQLVGLDVEECRDLPRGTTDYWKCYILHRSVSGYHPLGTCAMGAVVDGKLKVNGVQNLRIVDASVMPKGPISPETNSAVMMIAEKAADMIINGY